MARTNEISFSVRRAGALASALAAIWMAGAAGACAKTEPVSLAVVDRETGEALQTWRHHGRLFVAGRTGDRYSLRVTNHSDGRVLVVMSVDGVNIVTGETASSGQNGYVLDPHESYDVTGWRKSDAEVAAFAFAPLPQSYAARTGRPADVGVIGMAVFNERRPDPPPVAAPYRYRGWSEPAAPPPGAAPEPVPPPPAAADAASAPAVPSQRKAEAARSAVEAQAERRDDRLGTAHGARERSEVSETAFDRATPDPVYVRVIEYDTWDNLVARGVIPRAWRSEPGPRPFPAGGPGDGFVPDPPPGF